MRTHRICTWQFGQQRGKQFKVNYVLRKRNVAYQDEPTVWPRSTDTPLSLPPPPPPSQLINVCHCIILWIIGVIVGCYTLFITILDILARVFWPFYVRSHSGTFFHQLSQMKAISNGWTPPHKKDKRHRFFRFTVLFAWVDGCRFSRYRKQRQWPRSGKLNTKQNEHTKKKAQQQLIKWTFKDTHAFFFLRFLFRMKIF